MFVTDILVHYAEIATKGRNRNKFIDALLKNIRIALKGSPLKSIKRPPGRIWLTAKDGESFNIEEMHQLKKVYGIASYSPIIRCPLTLDAMKEVAWNLLKDRSYDSFRVKAKRSFKNQPLDSMSTAREVGAHILRNRDSKVKMKGADEIVYIEMVAKYAYLYTDKHPGPGGLPVGISGDLAVMLSGGIDSPVAAARMQQRGCKLSFIHFHSHPFVSRASMEKALELTQILTGYQNKSVLTMVPFGELQREIVTKAPEGLRVILYRRFMLRIAGEIALREKARALVTGEALGQVASQTLTNLITVDEAAPMPVIRPLIGFDKHEIIEHAQRLGSYDISIIPDQDCCQVFMPQNPQTHAKLEVILAAERLFDIVALCQKTLERVERIIVSTSSYKVKS